MAKGGKRLGAGRKQGFAAKSAEDARTLLAEMVMREIEPIGLALIKKAKKGDISACKELFDRAFGKAPQAISVQESPLDWVRASVERDRAKYRS